MPLSVAVSVPCWGVPPAVKVLPSATPKCLIARETESLHIGINEFAALVVTQHLGAVGGVDGNLCPVIVKGDGCHFIIFLTHSLDQPSTSNGSRSSLGGGVDDFSTHQHHGRAAGIHGDDVVHVGAKRLHHLAHHLGATPLGVSVLLAGGHVYHHHCQLFAIGTGSIRSAGIGACVVTVVVIAVGEFAILHHHGQSFDHILDFRLLSHVFVASVGHGVVHGDFIPHIQRGKQILLCARCGEACIIVAQCLPVGIGDNVLNDKSHVLIDGPPAAFFEPEVVVVGMCIAFLGVCHPVVFKLAGTRIGWGPKRDGVHEASAVHGGKGYRIGQLIACDGC